MSGSIVVGIVAIFLIGYGLVSLFNQDLVWSWKVYSERSRGHSEDSLEQTPEWENSTRLGGIISLAAGIFLIIVALTSF